MNDRNEKITESLESIMNVKNFNEIIKQLVKGGFISKSNSIISIAITVVLLPIIIKIGFSHDTVIRFTNMVEMSKDLIINLFGIMFTGYALFQAFTNGELIEKLLINTGDKKSLFEEYNLFFLKTCIIYLIIIGVNFILLIILNNISEEFIITILTNNTNNMIATILIALYFVAIIYSLLEIKSLLYNIYQAFNINALNEGIKALNNDD